MNKIDEVLAGSNAKDSAETSIEDSLLTSDPTEAENAKQHPFFAVARLLSQNSADVVVKESERDILNNYLKRPEVIKIIPDNGPIFGFI